MNVGQRVWVAYPHGRYGEPCVIVRIDTDEPEGEPPSVITWYHVAFMDGALAWHTGGSLSTVKVHEHEEG